MKRVGIIRRKIALLLIVALSINSFAAVVSDNDGSAFITKAEFDSLKNNFQSQIDQYNISIDNKIDGAIASYLNGIKVAKDPYAIQSCLNAHRDKKNNTGTILFVGTNNKRWFYSGTAIYSAEKNKGAFNQKPYLQKEIWTNVRSSRFKGTADDSDTFPAAYTSYVDYFIHAKWRNDDQRFGVASHETALLLLDDNNNAQNWRANPRIDFSHLFDWYIGCTATNWEPLAFPEGADGAIGTININELPDEMFYGQNTHNGSAYVSFTVNGGVGKFNQACARWGARTQNPKFAEIVDPRDNHVQDLGYVANTVGYNSTGTFYQYYKSNWNVSFNTLYGDGFGVYVPSAMKTETKVFAVHDWPSTDLLHQEHYVFQFGKATASVPAYDPSATNQQWIMNGTTASSSRQELGGLAARLASASQIYSTVNINGYFPEFNDTVYKDLKNINDAQVYDSLGEACPLAGCPLLFKPLDQAGTIEWNNIKFSNGYYASGVSAGNFTVLLNKNKFEESDINASNQVVISTPKPFKYKTHGSPTWSSEVTSLQPTKGTGYDFKFEVEKNEKIYFGVFDNAHLLDQSIVAQEMDADAMIFQPALD